MNFHLVVTAAFGSFNVGDRITDPADVEKYAASHPGHVVRVVAPDEPEPAPAPKPAAPTT